MANAGILDNDIESYVKQCIGKIIPLTILLTQSEKNESEEDEKFKEKIFNLIKDKKPNEAYYAIREIEPVRYESLYRSFNRDDINKRLLHIMQQAKSNEKEISEKAWKPWFNQLSKDQIDFLASFLLLNNAVYWHFNHKQFRGHYFVPSAGFLDLIPGEAKYVDNNVAAYKAVENYSDAKSHSFPVAIGLILEILSDDPLPHFETSYDLSCSEYDAMGDD